MNLVDRYIYAVSQYLPEESREDVERELRANIGDMLPENPSEEDVRSVLQELGNPKELAAGYTEKKRYLIGPGYYDQYIKVLQLVMGIVAAVITGVVILAWFVAPVSEGGYVQVISQFILRLLSALFSALLQAALWVTVTFVILERSGVGLDEYSGGQKNWTPADLGEVPVSGQGRISRVAVVLGMIFTILISAILYFQPELIFVVKSGNDLSDVTPLLDSGRLSFYLPFILILAAANLALLTWKYISGRWTGPLATANTVYNAGFALVVSLMLGDRALINQDIITEFGAIFSQSVEAAQTNVARFLTVMAAIVIVTSIWDSIEGFRLSRKSRRVGERR